MPPAERRQRIRVASASRSSKLTLMVPPLAQGDRVGTRGIIGGNDGLAQRDEAISAGQVADGPCATGAIGIERGSAVSVRVVTTMVLAAAGEARPPRARQQASMRASPFYESWCMSLHGNFLLIGKRVSTHRACSVSPCLLTSKRHHLLSPFAYDAADTKKAASGMLDEKLIFFGRKRDDLLTRARRRL